MILFSKAQSIVMSQDLSIGSETVPLSEALGRFLAEPIVSPLDAPPFDKSAMDGYAVRADDDRKQYTLRNSIAAGESPLEAELQPGEADKIMTGAPLPAGAGKVIRVEYTEETSDGFALVEDEPYANIIFKGENLKAGDLLLKPCRIQPKEIGCLAAAGIAQVTVKKKLRMGIINTGNEIKTVGQPLLAGEIYDSNGPQLKSQIFEAGGEAIPYGIIADTKEAHATAIGKALRECDILLLTGGVSKGDYDYVPDVLREAGVRELFHGVRVKPGRPTFFGRTDSCVVFGLPGNPVTVFVQFEAMVRPLMHKLCGTTFVPKCFQGRLTKALKRRDVERAEFMPATTRLEEKGIFVSPLRYGGSSHLNALALADCLIFVPGGVERLEAGDFVEARLL